MFTKVVDSVKAAKDYVVNGVTQVGQLKSKAVTYIKEVDYKQKASDLVNAIVKIAAIIVTLAVAAFGLVKAPIILSAGLIIGLAFPTQTQEVVKNITKVLDKSNLIEKAICAIAAFALFPVTTQVAVFYTSSNFISEILSRAPVVAKASA